jgi:hypothetical protein
MIASARLSTCWRWWPFASIPLFGFFGERLSAAGKHKRLINGAVTRKLLVLAYGILRSGVPFDANYA